MGTLVGEYHGMQRDKMLGVLRPDQVGEGQKYALGVILDNTPAVVNTHVTALYEGEYMIGKDLEIGLNPQYYVVVVADPEQIVKWREERNKIGGRKSKIESPAEITLHQSIVLSVTRALAEYHNSGLTVVYNSPKATEGNVESIGAIVKSIVK